MTESIIFFGDSYTDGGRGNPLFAATAGFPIVSPAIFTQDRFSDGLSYSDVLPGLVGVDAGTVQNFAIGGARSLTDRTIGEFLVGAGLPAQDVPEGEVRMDIDGQIDEFLGGLAPGADLSGTLISLFIGINDVNAVVFDPAAGTTPEEQGATFGDSLFDSVTAQIQRLTDAGADTFVLATVPIQTQLPVRALTPPEERAMGDAAARQYNARLADEVETMQAEGINAKLVDFATLFDEVSGDFETFGFRTFLDPITLDFFTPNPAVDGVPNDQIALVDVIHPSQALYETMAVFQFESLTSEVTFGGDDGDFLRGSREDDMILGRGGDDFMLLRKGDDVGLGGQGDDLIFAGRGDDIAAGGSGDDLVKGGSGDDVLALGLGNDLAFGGRGDDVVVLGAGSDRAFGGSGDDAFIFVQEELFGRDSGDAHTLIFGGRGHDTLYLYVEDASAIEVGGYGRFFTKIDALGIKAFGIENVEVIEGTPVAADIDPENEKLAEAELWGFV